MKEDTHRILPAIGLIGGGIFCCDGGWLRKAADVGGVGKANVNRTEKRPADAGRFFDFRDCSSITPYFLYWSACHVVKYDREGRRVDDSRQPIEAFTLAHGRYPISGAWSVVGIRRCPKSLWGRAKA